MSISGYGFSVEDNHLVGNANFVLFEMMSASPVLKRRYDEFAAADTEHVGDFDGLLDAFFDSYDDVAYGNYGLEGLIVDLFDEIAFGSSLSLRYGEGCFFVSGQEMAQAGLSEADVEEKLADIGKLYAKPLDFRWFG